MNFTRLMSLGAIATGLAGAASAQLIYNNAPPNQKDATEMTRSLVAESFTLSSSTSLGWIRFWTFESIGSSYDGNVDWFVFDNNGGIPGNIVASGSLSYPSKTYRPQFFDYVYELDIPDVPLLGNTMYWLGLHVNQGYGTYRFIYWEQTYAGNAPTGQLSFGGTMNNWIDTEREHAFQLYGPVPEPSTIVVLGVLGALMLRRRK